MKSPVFNKLKDMSCEMTRILDFEMRGFFDSSIAESSFASSRIMSAEHCNINLNSELHRHTPYCIKNQLHTILQVINIYATLYQK